MTKPAVTLRNTKGSHLTFTELDTNFTNLKDATVTLTAGSGGTAVSADLNGTITLVAGTNITLIGDNTAKTITIASSGGSGGLNNVVEDTTPQLGGDLDVNGYKIVSASNGSITIDPDGTGQIYLDSTIVNVTSQVKCSSSTLSITPLNQDTVTMQAQYVYIGQTTGTNAGVLTTSDQGRDLTLTCGNGFGTINIDGNAGTITMTPYSTGKIDLAGPLKTNATTGAPTTYENGYYEDMLMTPVSWLKINIGGSDYYLPLYQ